MGKVTYNQHGYVGQSMSVRARDAYEDGERPKSKWTKAAMLDAMEDYCELMGIAMPEDAKAMKKGEIFARYFKWTGWHHTGKFANETDFYGVDGDAVWDASEGER